MNTESTDSKEALKRNLLGTAKLLATVAAVVGIIYVASVPLIALSSFKETAKKQRQVLEIARARAEAKRERLRASGVRQGGGEGLWLLEAPLVLAAHLYMEEKFKPMGGPWDFDFSDMFENQSLPTGDLGFSFWPSSRAVKQSSAESPIVSGGTSLRHARRPTSPDDRTGSDVKNGNE